MSEHAFLSYSSSDDWVVCTAAPMLRALHPGPPEEPGSPSAVGTAAHELCARFVDDLAHGRFLPDESVIVGQAASNGELFTDEMYDAAVIYSRDIQRVMQEEGVFTPHIEERTTPGAIHPTEAWGTPDCWLWSPTKQRLYLWDFKFGYRPHRPTSYQFVGYVADTLESLGINGLDDQKVTVAVRVIQPHDHTRSGDIHEWRGYASELRSKINIMRAAAEEALTRPKCVVGPQCEFCSARPCDALRMANLNRLRYVDEPNVTVLSDADAGIELKIMRQAREEIDAHITGLEAQLEQSIKAGNRVPGWVLDRPPGRLNWTCSSAEACALGDAMGIDIRKPETPLTPTQAIAAGVDKEIVNQYSARKPGSAKLVEDTSAKEAFENGN